MTIISLDAILGPGKYGFFGWGGSPTLYNLDDNNDAVAFGFAVPHDGVITDIGFLLGAKVGSPPEYKIGIVTMSGAVGTPSTQNYGGSVPVGWTPDNTAQLFKWFTLTTPASGITGDIVAIRIYPDGTVPNVSNYARVSYDSLDINGYYILPRVHRFTTGWTTYGGWGFWGIKYEDGTVYGITTSGLLYQEINSATTPDEVGVKFSLPATVRCTGPSLTSPNIETDAGIDVILYDEYDQILRSISFADFDLVQDNYAAINGAELKWNSPITLSGGNTYRLTMKGTTTPAGIFFSGVVLDSSTSRANNKLSWINSWQMTERTDLGSWTDYNDRLVALAIQIDGIEITVSGGEQGSGGGAYAYIG